jgi:hypothetical protein
MNLAYRAGRIRRVMKYTMRVDEVECIIRKWQVYGISLDETAGESSQPKPFLGQPHRRVGEVNGSVMSTRASEALRFATTSATDLEDAQAAGFFKTDRLGKARVHSITVFVETAIELRRSRRLSGEPRIAREALPEFLDLALEAR